MMRERDIAIAKAGGTMANVLPEVDDTVMSTSLKSVPGVIQTTDGPMKEYVPPTPSHTKAKGVEGYCETYAKRMDKEKKWTTKACKPEYGKYADIMENLDGVICACG